MHCHFTFVVRHLGSSGWVERDRVTASVAVTAAVEAAGM